MKLGMDARNQVGDGDRRKCIQEIFDGTQPTHPILAASPVDTVQQFGNGDHADRPLLFCADLLEGAPAPLGVDEHVCVDQDGQDGGSGAGP